jgi:quercetin dioxygenase-like cupin family protein
MADWVVPWDDQRKREHEHGFMMPFIGAEIGAKNFSVHVSVIRAGEASHAPHVHEGEEVIFMLEGTAEVTVGDEVRTVGPNSAIYYTPNVPHGLRNIGTTDMRYLVVRER